MKKLFFILMLVSSLCNAQQYTQQDIDICNSKFELFTECKVKDKPVNDILITVAKSFIGLEYAAGTLDQGDKEELVIHLSGLDCYTFLESSFVLARIIKQNKTDFESFQKELKSIRYRNGIIDGYTSRLHYFSDWIFEMDKRGIGKDITREIGGVKYENNVFFMSKNPGYYKQLKNDSVNVGKISDIENTISKRDYFYIPQDQISRVEKSILSGDLIGITTNIEGLDIAHTGIAIRSDDGRIHLLHSPNVGKKIQITEAPLAEYVKRNTKQTGIIVLRPLEL